MDIFIRFEGDNWKEKILNSVTLIEDHIEKHGPSNAHTVRFLGNDKAAVSNPDGKNRENYILKR